jgi:hypothetical protein
MTEETRMKAIVIDEPWIGMILSGRKTWEMRKTACHHRGTIALIRKGGGTVVGVAEVIASRPPLASLADYAAAEDRHGIPPDRQARAFEDGWRTPWVLRGARPLARPVSYDHPSGAVIWVNLGEEVARAVELAAGPAPVSAIAMLAGAAPEPMTVIAARGVSTAAESSAIGITAVASASEEAESRAITVTGGNLRNNHLYLPLDFFPADAIGGRNRAEAALRTITVTFSPGQTVECDIDGTKRILRTRGPVGDFFARAGVRDGDVVRVVRTGPYAYRVDRP